MTAFYTGMAATAAAMVREFGQAVTVSRKAAGTYSPSTGAATVTTTTQAGLGVEVAYTAREIDGTLVLAGDKKLILGPLNAAGASLTAPQMDDTITLADGGVWTIRAIEPLSPAGTLLIWTLQLRRA